MARESRHVLWPQPKRAERHRAMFGRTQAFLPAANGIRINALHLILHVATLATVLLIGWMFIPQ